MEYAINKKNKRSKAHIWNGMDTVCGLSDIYSLERYTIVNNDDGRGVCDYCRSGTKMNIPSKKKKAKSYVVGRNKSNTLKEKVVATERDWSYKKNSRVKRIKINDFLLSFEWRKLRMEAIKKYGTRCMCCGASPKDGVVINVDHIKPRKTHPELSLDMDNLQILCDACNHGKGNWDTTDWRK